MKIPAIAIHGGSGTITFDTEDPALKDQYLKALNDVLDEGFAMLTEGCSATESVCKAVTILEDCDLFNTGKGSVFTAKGEHEMDAAIMDGKTLKAGAVAGLQGVKNPVLVAYDVLQNTPLVMIAGEETIEYARQKDFKFEPDSYFFTQLRYDQWQKIKGDEEMKLDHSGEGAKFSTVGAVAVDVEGNVAGESSAIVKHGIESSCFNPPVVCIPNEKEALLFAMENVLPGTLIMLCVEQIEEVISMLKLMQLQEKRKQIKSAGKVMRKKKDLSVEILQK